MVDQVSIKVPDTRKIFQWAWEKQLAKADHSNLIEKFDSMLMKHCDCEDKSNLLSRVIRLAFVDPPIQSQTLIVVIYSHGVLWIAVTTYQCLVVQFLYTDPFMRRRLFC